MNALMRCVGKKIDRGNDVKYSVSLVYRMCGFLKYFHNNPLFFGHLSVIGGEPVLGGLGDLTN